MRPTINYKEYLKYIQPILVVLQTLYKYDYKYSDRNLPVKGTIPTRGNFNYRSLVNEYADQHAHGLLRRLSSSIIWTPVFFT
jgi:hypothetical protein